VRQRCRCGSGVTPCGSSACSAHNRLRPSNIVILPRNIAASSSIPAGPLSLITASITAMSRCQVLPIKTYHATRQRQRSYACRPDEPCGPRPPALPYNARLLTPPKQGSRRNGTRRRSTSIRCLPMPDRQRQRRATVRHAKACSRQQTRQRQKAGQQKANRVAPAAPHPQAVASPPLQLVGKAAEGE